MHAEKDFKSEIKEEVEKIKINEQDTVERIITLENKYMSTLTGIDGAQRGALKKGLSNPFNLCVKLWGYEVCLGYFS